jgi:processive 1,2-diacylglycerol beta-glucosyltransferase
MQQRVMILTAGVGSGHNVAATALTDACRLRADVAAVLQLDVLDLASDLYRTLYDDMYFTMVDALPWLVSWGYERNNPPFRPNLMQRWWDQFNTTAVVRALHEFAPTTVICTHFLPARLVSLLIARGVLQATVTVVTTDYDFQGLWLSIPFHRFTVARDETRAHMIELGLPGDRISETGIPISLRFDQPFRLDEVRERFALRADRPLVLISAGAAGGSYTESVVSQVLELRLPFQAMIICGRNDELRETLEQLTAAQRDRFQVLGYCNDMPDLLRAASVFIGKPGGLASSECMAAGLPMILVKPIPGQETRNSDFLLEGGAAVRCNYETTVGYKLAWLLQDPQRLARMAAAAQQIGRPRAAVDVITQALVEQPEPLWISRDAQRLIRTAAEQGFSARRSGGHEQVVTLVDGRNGRSRGLITGEQLTALRAAESELERHGVIITARRLRRWRSGGLDSDLLTLLHRLLGREERCSLLIEPGD